MTGTAIDASPPSQVPALRHSAASQIDADDVAIPRIYVAHPLSKAVQNGFVKAGEIYAALGADDADPQVLAKKGSEDGVVFHVLSLLKGRSWSEDGGQLERWAFDDPSARPDAWTTYLYTIACPAIDPDLPFRVLFTKSGKPAARKINSVLARQAGHAADYEAAFRLTVGEATNSRGQKYFVPRIAVVDPTTEDVKVAEGLYDLVNQIRPEPAATPADPAI